MSKRRSAIWSVSKEEFKQYVANSSSFTELLAYFSLENKGGNYKTVRQRMFEENVNYDHFKNLKNIYINLLNVA